MSGERFRVIDAGAPAKPRRRAGAKAVWECRICEPVDGVRSRYMTKVRQGAVEDSRGRISGGRDVWVCAICLSRGVFTPTTS